MDWESRFSLDAEAIKASEIRELLKLLDDPSILSFAGGIPDPSLFPMDEVAAIRDRLEERPDLNRHAMQYSQTEGYPPLRRSIATRFSTTETKLTEDNILVTNGAQQSLTLLAAALIDAGTPIAVANPTYLGALQVFSTRRPDYHTIDTDDGGLIINSLENAFKNGVKLLYTIPEFQNPGGMTLNLQRRQQIVELAHQFNVIIIEDTAYRDLYYDAPPPPSLLTLEGQYLGTDNWQDNGLVLQLGTASKTLMPALRVGWTIAPKQILKKLVLLKQANDLHTSTLNQIITHELSESCLKDHIKTLRHTYGKRRDAMVESLRQYLPNGATFTKPGGGMFIWLTMPKNINARDLLEKALATEKLAFVPGDAFSANGSGANTLRLSFATCSEHDIIDGMKRLSSLIQREILAAHA